MKLIHRILFCSFVLFGLESFSQDLDSDIEKAKELTYSNRIDEAVELLFDVISRAEEVNNDSALGQAHIRLGTAYAEFDKISIGLDHYWKAYAIGKSMNDSLLIAQSYFGIGLMLKEMKKYERSIEYYDSAIQYYSGLKDSTTLSYLYSNLSNLYSIWGKPDQMDFFSRKALKIQLQDSDFYGAAVSYSNLGLFRNKKQDFDSALSLYRLSAKYYNQEKYLNGLIEVYNNLANNFYLIDQDDSSAYYFRRADSLGHDLFHQDYQDKILELETKYKTAELERDNALQEAELEENQKQLTMLIAAILILSVLAAGGYYLVDQRRKRIKAISDQKIQDLLQSQEMETAYALLDGQDQERKRIAAELHDNLGSILVSLNMFADSLTAKSDDPKMQQIAERISKTSKEANETVRQISHSLDSGLLKHFGLKAAISQLAEAIEMSKNIKVILHLNIEDEFNNELGLELYRIIQELFNNALKHAQCTEIRLELNQIDNSLNLIFEDNGKGFDLSQSSRGMGLSNIETRAEKLGGELNIDSKPGRGSTFIIEIQELWAL